MRFLFAHKGLCSGDQTILHYIEIFTGYIFSSLFLRLSSFFLVFGLLFICYCREVLVMANLLSTILLLGSTIPRYLLNTHEVQRAFVFFNLKHFLSTSGGSIAISVVSTLFYKRSQKLSISPILICSFAFYGKLCLAELDE